MTNKSPSAYFRGFILCAVWCISAGQFLEQRLPFGHNDLFWSLWIAICLIIWLSQLVLDDWWNRRKPRN